MTEAIAFDTHRFAKRLTERGFTEKQAETLAEEHVAPLDANLATNTDIAEVKAEIEALKPDLPKLKADLPKWNYVHGFTYVQTVWSGGRIGVMSDYPKAHIKWQTSRKIKN